MTWSETLNTGFLKPKVQLIHIIVVTVIYLISGLAYALANYFIQD